MLTKYSVIDTHVHNALWGAGLAYTYPKAFPALSGRNWTIDEYAAATGQSGISAVLMELEKAGDAYEQSLAEARHYQRIADECDRPRSGCSVAAIVASAPVTLGATVMRSFLNELVDAAPRTRGIREALWHRPASAYLHNKTYLASLRELVAHDLTLDLLINRTQLTAVAQLADALPKLRINVNHVRPPRLEHWSKAKV